MKCIEDSDSSIGREGACGVEPECIRGRMQTQMPEYRRQGELDIERKGVSILTRRPELMSGIQMSCPLLLLRRAPLLLHPGIRHRAVLYR